MRVHVLKTWPSFYAAIISGAKRFEVRRNDRDYAVGDILHLVEWDPTPVGVSGYVGASGHESTCAVSYILHGGRHGIDPRYVVMGISDVRAIKVPS